MVKLTRSECLECCRHSNLENQTLIYWQNDQYINLSMKLLTTFSTSFTGKTYVIERCQKKKKTESKTGDFHL